MIGFYPYNNRKLPSVTTIIDYALGLPEELAEWATKQALLQVQREQKGGKVFTQKEVLEVGLNARRSILRKSQILGTQVHQAIQNHNNGLSYEFDDEKHQIYFDAFYNWAKHRKLIPILQEEKVYNPDHGYAGRIDFYGELDGKKVLIDFKTSNQVRWTYGLQLSAYRKCLEMMGHPVEAMYVLHVKPIKRGGQEPCAVLYEFTTDFSVFEALLKIFWYKVSTNDVEWQERTDALAIEKELAEAASPVNEPALPSDAQGQCQETPDTSPSTPGTVGRWVGIPGSEHSSPGGISIPSTDFAGFLFAEETPTTRSSSQPEGLTERTSEQQTETPRETPALVSLQEGVVVLFDKHQRPLETSKPPLATDTSGPQADEIELDTRRLRRLGIDV